MKTWKSNRVAGIFRGLTAAAALAVAWGPIGSGWSQDKPVAKLLTDLETLVEGNNQFALDLYARLAKEPGNIIFSPYSISSALAMTYAGARGETAEQIARVLHFSLGQERLHPAFSELIADLQKDELARRFELYVANALWGQRGYSFLNGFAELGRNRYCASLQELDFSEQTEMARQTINRWVEDQTKEKIKKLLGPSDLTPQTRLVLTNAIYLKAAWETPFLKSKTKESSFEITPTETILVPMMQTQIAHFKYFSANSAEWLELPYIGARLSMIVVLPKQRRLAEFEKSLTPTAINEAITKLKFHRGSVSFPRFKLNAATQLASELSNMGMPIAFSTKADFTGMLARRELKIGKIIHQAYLSVDEVGSEAAAATAVELDAANYPPFSFTANAPFIFFIRDNRTNSLLFFGRVANPRVVV